jgi:hypothetical protein
MIDSGNSITGDYYKDNCLKPLFNNIRGQRPKIDLHDIKLHHDNGKLYQTKYIKMFLED